MTIALLGLFALASCASEGADPTPEPETISSSDAALAVTWGQMPADDEAIICEAWNEYLVPRSELLDAFFAGLDEPSTFGRAQVDQFIEAQCDP
jgi:hypothetical protein